VNDYLGGHLWLFDVRGTAKAKRILEVFEYARKRYGITQFVIDSLAKCGFAEDDYNGQKNFVDQITDFVRDHNCHIHLVAHGRKTENEAPAPGTLDVKGTGAITDMVDNVLSVWRNKPKEAELQKSDKAPASVHEKPDAMIEVCKQRNGEWEGKILLWFDRPSQQYLEKRGDQIRFYLTERE
jgi:twinkle protein